MWPWWVMIPIEDLTDVTQAIEDTDEDDEEDLTDVTLVSDDTYWRLDWCYSSNWGSVESYQVMKVIKWWKLSSDGSHQVMKVEITKEVIRSDGWWRFACGDVLYWNPILLFDRLPAWIFAKHSISYFEFDAITINFFENPRKEWRSWNCVCKLNWPGLKAIQAVQQRIYTPAWISFQSKSYNVREMIVW